MKVLDVVASVLLIIGALNWGFIGLFNFNLVTTIFGEATAISRVIYAVVGLCALYEVGSFAFGFREIQHRWCESHAATKQ